jgi:hypothetical protein
MSRALFIGDSQTCGYWSHPTKTGPGSYSYWNDNNYAEIYGEDNNKPVAVYAMAGVCNRVYTDWLATMFEKYNDIDEVFICLAPFNRFRIGFDGILSDNVVPIDHFTTKMEKSNGVVDLYCDLTIKEEKDAFIQHMQGIYSRYLNYLDAGKTDTTFPSNIKQYFNHSRLFVGNPKIKRQNYIDDLKLNADASNLESVLKRICPLTGASGRVPVLPTGILMAFDPVSICAFLRNLPI